MTTNINGVTITLTPDQISQIKQQERKSRPITERVTTIDEAFEELGKSRADFDKMYGKLPQHIIGYALATEIVAPAIKEGWEPDWSNTNQPKYQVWMEWNGSGFRFFLSDDDYQYSPVGSRLVFQDGTRADHFGTFTALINQYFC